MTERLAWLWQGPLRGHTAPGSWLLPSSLRGLGCAAVALGEVLERLARRADRAGHVAAAVDPVDAHLALAAIDEAVRHAARDPGHVLGDEVEALLADDGGRLAFEDHHRLLDVVGVQGDLRARPEDRHPGGDLVALGVPLADQRDGLDASPAIEQFDVGGVQDLRIADGSIARGLIGHRRLPLRGPLRDEGPISGYSAAS